MFDISFSEILVIGVVALVVIGPERLPKTARTLGHLFGRLQRYVSEVKADISREMELDELRKLRQEVNTAAQEIQTSVTNAVADVQTGVQEAEAGLAGLATEATTRPAPEGASIGAPVEAGGVAPLAMPDPAAPSSVAMPRAEVAAPATTLPTAGPPAEPHRQASLPGLERP